eukprot:scaffold32131_cov26-Tisochrysis_lutea.AAC.4
MPQVGVGRRRHPYCWPSCRRTYARSPPRVARHLRRGASGSNRKWGGRQVLTVAAWAAKARYSPYR